MSAEPTGPVVEAADAPAPIDWVIGAYAAAPSRVGWDPGAEAAYLDALLALPGVSGFEVPFTDALHKQDEGWLLARLPRDAQVVVTTAPGTSDRVRASRLHGLASTDPEGRAAALAHVRAARDAVHRLLDAVGTGCVRAVELHAAPPHLDGASTADALQRSLTEVAAWDWGGARLVVEHCDAAVPGQRPAKGYLPLEEDLASVAAVNAATGAELGVGLNWARSVVETRDPDAGRRHVQRVREAGLLAGLVLSGCSPVATRFGGPWADVHAPLAPSAGAPVAREDLLEPTSLLTAERVRQTLRAAGAPGPRDYRGVKVAAPPDAGVEDRIAAVAASLAVVRGVEASLSTAVGRERR